MATPFFDDLDTHSAPRAAALDYRTPSEGGDRLAWIANELAKGEALGAAAATGRLATGLPLCLIGPAFIASLVEGIAARWDWRGAPKFDSVFLVAALLGVPILMWLERRTRGNFLNDFVREEAASLPVASYGGFCIERERVFWALYTEIALLGPRLVWSFVDWLRGRPLVDAATRLEAAGIVAALYAREAACPIAELVTPEHPRADVARAVRYLLAKEWIDLSARRDRVWLSSRVRDRLAGAMKPAGRAI